MSTRTNTVDRKRLTALIVAEREQFAANNSGSKERFQLAGEHLWTGVPMAWMAKWPGGFPLSMDGARGARVTDVDGHEYIDFCLGDTGAMAGHSPAATVSAVEQRISGKGGITTMLPTDDATWVGGELARRFGLPQWSFTLSATDANRFIVRKARQITARPKILCFSWCYHGSVDETIVILDGEKPRSRPGNVGPAVDPTSTTKVCEFNDLNGVERLLFDGDVACVLMEPALTNIGIVLPEPGFLEGVRELTRAAGTLLINDETHTISAGPGGCTEAWSLDPDIVTIGKAIGGGVPIGAYGVSAEIAQRLKADEEADYIDTGGVGGTLAGNALSLAAARATLGEVLTGEAFDGMINLATRFTDGVNEALDRFGAPWVCIQLGARSEYRFTAEVPKNGGQSAAADDPGLDEFLHLWMLNRGILMTPFHNMALMCPQTSVDDVDRHTEVFTEALAAIFSS